MAFFALDLGDEMLFMIEYDKTRKSVNPDPGDLLALFFKLGDRPNPRAFRLDSPVTAHTIAG